MTTPRILAAAILALAALPASAADIFVGAYKHAVDLPTDLYTGEHGYDVQLGYRFDHERKLAFIGAPAPYLIVSINTHGDTSFGGGGLSWKFGNLLYVRPGIGMVFTGRSGTRYETDRRSRHYDHRIDLGSPVLFEPELAIGYRIAPRVSIEASWTHISHATIFSHQNPGIDMLGARLVLHLP